MCALCLTYPQFHDMLWNNPADMVLNSWVFGFWPTTSSNFKMISRYYESSILLTMFEFSNVSPSHLLFFSLLQIIMNSLPNLTSGVWLKDLVLWRSAGTLKGLSIFALAFSCQTWVSPGPRLSVQTANTDFDLLQRPPWKLQAMHHFRSCQVYLKHANI